MFRYEPEAQNSAAEFVRRYGERASAVINQRIDACIAANDLESALTLDRLRRQVAALIAA